MDLEQINRERRRRRLRELSQRDVEQATASKPPGIDWNMFLLTYEDVPQAPMHGSTADHTDHSSNHSSSHSGGTDGTSGGYDTFSSSPSSDSGSSGGGGGGGDP